MSRGVHGVEAPVYIPININQASDHLWLKFQSQLRCPHSSFSRSAPEGPASLVAGRETLVDLAAQLLGPDLCPLD